MSTGPNTVEVKLTADGSGLTQGAEKAATQMQASASRIRASFEGIAQTLGGQLTTAIAKLNTDLQGVSRQGFEQLTAAGRQAASAITAQTTQIGQGFDRIHDVSERTLLAIQQQTATVNQRLETMSTELSQVHTRTQQASQSTTGFGNALVATGARLFSITAILAGIKKAFGIESEFEQLSIQLNAVTGSALAGEQAFAWVKDFAQRTPYDVKQTAQAFVMLKNAGLDPMDGTLKSIADTASKYTTGTDGMTRVITQLTQAYGKGKVQAEDMNVLAEAGVPAFAALAQATGKSTEEIQKLSSEGKLGKDAVRALIDELGRMSDGQAEAKMQSLAGLWSNFGDAISNALDDLRTKGGGLEPLKDALTAINQAFANLRASGELEMLIAKFGEVLQTGAAIFHQLFGIVSDVFGAIAQVFSGLTSAISANTGEQIGFLDLLNVAFKALEVLVIGLRGSFEIAWAAIRATTASAISIVMGMADSLMEKISKLAEWVMSHLLEAGIAFSTFAEVAQRALALDFSGAKAAYQTGLGQIEAEVKASAGRIAAIDADAKRKAQENVAARVEAFQDVVDAAERTKQRIENTIDRYGVTPDTSATPAGAGSRPRTPVQLNLADGKDKSRTRDWQAELNADKIAFDQKREQEGTYYEYSKRDELAFWANIKATHQLSQQELSQVTAKELTLRMALRREEARDQIAQLRQQVDDQGRNIGEKQAKVNEYFEWVKAHFREETAEYRTALAEKQKIDREAADHAVQVQVEEAQLKAKLRIADLDDQRELLRAQLQAGELTHAEELRAERELSRERYEIKRQELLAEVELYAAINPEKAAAARRAASELDGARKVETQRETRQAQAITPEQERQDRRKQQDTGVEKAFGGGAIGIGAKNVFNGLETSFTTALTNMLTRAQTWRQALNGLWQSASKSFIQDMVVKPAVEWAAGQARMLAITIATKTKELIFGKAASATQAATAITTAGVEIGAKAPVAAAGAAGAMAGIPFVGPALAVAAMAATLAAVIGLKGSIPSAAGGYSIPRGINPLTQLHEEEMVLPKGIANPLRDALANGGLSGAGNGDGGAAGVGESHFNLHFHGPSDRKSIANWLMDNKAGVAMAVKGHLRNGGG